MFVISLKLQKNDRNEKKNVIMTITILDDLKKKF